MIKLFPIVEDYKRVDDALGVKCALYYCFTRIDMGVYGDLYREVSYLVGSKYRDEQDMSAPTPRRLRLCK